MNATPPLWQRGCTPELLAELARKRGERASEDGSMMDTRSIRLKLFEAAAAAYDRSNRIRRAHCLEGGSIE
ncbi:MAG: hypothetical protein AAF950_07200 [Pseudomonadota bacterium]